MTDDISSIRLIRVPRSEGDVRIKGGAVEKEYIGFCVDRDPAFRVNGRGIVGQSNLIMVAVAGDREPSNRDRIGANKARASGNGVS